MPHPLDASTWLFDLDNTLYAHRHNLFAQVSKRMTQFIVEHLGLEFGAAKNLQTKYFHEYGTTLRGLMQYHDIPPEDFLHYVHEINYSTLPPNPALDTLLHRLPARKIIFTNGSTTHAKSVIRQLGIEQHFTEFFDIADADYLPKPAMSVYQQLIDKYVINPKSTLMLEDMAINLKPAKQLGMQTLWLRTPEEWANPQDDRAYIDYVGEDLTDWLTEVLS